MFEGIEGWIKVSKGNRENEIFVDFFGLWQSFII